MPSGNYQRYSGVSYEFEISPNGRFGYLIARNLAKGGALPHQVSCSEVLITLGFRSVNFYLYYEWQKQVPQPKFCSRAYSHIQALRENI